MNNNSYEQFKQQQQLLNEIEEHLRPYSSKFAFVVGISERSETPLIAYAKNCTNVFALAITQHIETRLSNEVKMDMKN